MRVLQNYLRGNKSILGVPEHGFLCEIMVVCENLLCGLKKLY